MKCKTLAFVLLAVFLLPSCTQLAQNNNGYKVDALKFQKNGFMSDADAGQLIENAKRSAALQVYIWSLPRISAEQIKVTNREFGLDTLTLPITEDYLKPSTIVATGNQSTIYAILGLDFDGEPLVIEYPKIGLGYIDDGWQRSLYDSIPSKKKSKPLFIVPINHQGEIPSSEQYTIIRPKTSSGIFLARGLGKKEDAVAGLKQTRIYYYRDKSYKDRHLIPEQKFVNFSAEPYRNMKLFDIPRGLDYWKRLHSVVQKDLMSNEDRAMYGLMQFIGIEKGKPFAPSQNMAKLLSAMEATAYKTVHAIGFSDHYAPRYYNNGSDWTRIFLVPEDAKNARKGSREVFDYKNFLGVYQRAHFAQNAQTTTPLAAMKFVGKGSQYLYSFSDSEHNTFDGGQTYQLHVPANIPAKDFWSITLYDSKSRSMLQGTGSMDVTIDSYENLLKNPDGSYDLFVGPDQSKVPEKFKGSANVISSNPDKGFMVYFRFFGPLEPFFNKTYQLESFEKLK